MNNQFDREEAKRRLAHLATLPETGPRRCEMAALRRLLEMDPSQIAVKTRTRRATTGTRRQVKADLPDEPQKPLREISRTAEGKKRVIIRKNKEEKKDLKDESREDRERMKRIKDFRTTLGQGF